MLNKYSAEIKRFELWLRDNRITQKDAAYKLGCSVTWLNLIINLHADPGQGLAMKIETYTKGYIKAVNLRPDDKTMKEWRG